MFLQNSFIMIAWNYIELILTVFLLKCNAMVSSMISRLLFEKNNIFYKVSTISKFKDQVQGLNWGKIGLFLFFYLIAYFSQINWVEQMHHNFMVREKTIFVNSDFQWWTKYFCALKTKVIMKALLQNYEVINAM